LNPPSLLLSLYGAANVASNIVFASRDRAPSFTTAYVGQGLGAFGFVLIGLLAGNGADAWLLPAIALACMLIAIGGPMHDLRLLGTVQGTGSSAAVSGVFRIRLITQHLGLLAGTLVAPTLLREFGVAATVLGMGMLLATMSFLAWHTLNARGLR